MRCHHTETLPGARCPRTGPLAAAASPRPALPVPGSPWGEIGRGEGVRCGEAACYWLCLTQLHEKFASQQEVILDPRV